MDTFLDIAWRIALIAAITLFAWWLLKPAKRIAPLVLPDDDPPTDHAGWRKHWDADGGRWKR